MNKKYIGFIFILFLNNRTEGAEALHENRLVGIGEIDPELFSAKTLKDRVSENTIRTITQFLSDKTDFLEKTITEHSEGRRPAGRIRSGNFASVDFNTMSTLESRQTLQELFALYTMINLTNYALDDRLHRNHRSGILIDSSPIEISPNPNNLQIEIYILIQKLIKLTYDYQVNREWHELFLILSNETIIEKLIQYSEEDDENFLTTGLIVEIYEIMITDLFLCCTRLMGQGVKTPLSYFIHREALKVFVYFNFFYEYEGAEVSSGRLTNSNEIVDNIKRFIEEMSLGSIVDPAEFFHYNKATKKLEIRNMPKLKDTYFALYNKATKENTEQVTIDVEDFWAKPINVHVTPNISGMIEGYIQPAQSLASRAKRSIAKGAKAIEKEVGLLMEELGLEEEKHVSEPVRSSKKKKAGKQKLLPAAAAAAEPIQAAAEEESLVDSESSAQSLYTFNKTLSSKRIEFNDRVLNWYKTTPKGTNRGITTQGYLDKGTDRNRILQEEVDRCDGNQEQAIHNITFRHQLPYSLIRSIASYGTIQKGSHADRTSITAIVGYSNSPDQSHYLAEVTGKIEGNTFKIWHTFLRPIRSVGKFLQENLLSLDHLKTDEAIADLGIDEDQKFKILGEEDDWVTRDQFNFVIISNGPIQYSLFKN